MANRKYLGVGIKYPYSIDQFGSIELQSDVALIQQSIIRILDTLVGSQFFNRSFGSYIRSLIFEPNDNVLVSLLDFHVTDAIDKWEKRVETTGVIIESSDTNPSLVNVRVEYRILASNEIDSFIYPFYRELKN